MKFKQVNKFYQQLILTFLLGLFFSLYPIIISAQTTISPEEFVRQAESLYQKGQILESANNLEKALNMFQEQTSENIAKIAITATNLCRIQIELGQGEKAINTCDLAINNYRQTNNLLGIKQSQLYQTYALQNLGLYPLACQKISEIINIDSENCQAFKYLEDLKDLESFKSIQIGDILTIEAWRSLAEILRVIGQFPASQTILETLSKELEQNPNIASELFLSLGNIYTVRGNLERERVADTKYNYIPWEYEKGEIYQKSLTDESYYKKAQESYQKASQSLIKETQLKAQLNLSQLLLLQNKVEQAEKLHNELNLTQIPLTQFRIYAKIQYTKQQQWINSLKNQHNYTKIIELLEESVQEANSIETEKSQYLISYTLGNLGSFYEYLSYQKNDNNALKKAQELTQKALYLSQPQVNPSLAYQWQWQLARLEKAAGNLNQAKDYYESAIKTLETVRKNILIIRQDIQFSFRDNIEPLYREFIDSLLELNQKNNDPEILKIVLKQFNSLQLAELENFLQCDLSSATGIKEIGDSQVMIISPIFLKDKLALIYQIPAKNNYINYQKINISNQEVTKILKNLQNYLGEVGNGCSKCEIPRESQKVYQWIIKPLEPILQENKDIKTLVFILDGLLRNIPMSALYDAEKQEYLLQKDYAIAIVPGLTLLQPQSSSKTPTVLLGGYELEQKINNLSFPPIKYLREELENIAKIFPTSSLLLNQDFTEANLQKELQTNQYSVIHWKTHGIFSSNPDDTFIVASNQVIKPNELSQLINTGSQEKTSPIDLLVLSACQTAKGDNRAVLGLAGIAVKAGTSSTLSTLWRAEDKANTKLMTDFYQALSQPNMTKSKALHQAQLSLFTYGIEYKDPHYWANYILVGNWQ
ncbi:CHAT domain-containing protein [Aphanothece sacrum]|uniref:Tetratricopeptide repeat domain protein n=1 Tax=Aphanothece sacrum FPU1 TaxID=1920663 RepID=A0A401IL80_APHSA|nr:CHAT domain-containing protein [Aphanothece sacrum]GBF82013.1 tetratricopeptide repeat domain protein [Aphanothece sacrum FPU1]GBF85831.1 tetratricopeptide repeat protein [Aphanothece sacrum FPU3]